MIHIGQKIEEIVRTKRFPIVEFARKINTTRNNVYNIFSRESIDTELLRKIGDILEFDFFQLLSRVSNVSNGIMPDVMQVYSVKYKTKEIELKDMILLLQKENEQLKEHLADKDEIISLMKNKVEFCSCDK